MIINASQPWYVARCDACGRDALSGNATEIGAMQDAVIYEKWEERGTEQLCEACALSRDAYFHYTKQACPHNWSSGYCDLCGSVIKQSFRMQSCTRNGKNAGPKQSFEPV